MSQIIDILRSDEATSSWLDALETAGDPPEPMPLPPATVLPAVLRDLGVTEEDIADLLPRIPDPEASPDLWRLVQRCAWSIVAGMGTIGDWPPLPRWPQAAGTTGHAFYVWVFLASLPFSRAFHAERGIPDSVSRATFGDLGRSIGHGRRRYGTADIHDPWWLALHLRGALYELGRLQFERGRLGDTTSQAMIAAGVDVTPGEPVLSVHIPAFSGPMDPAACDASIAQAMEFFPRYFPEETFIYAVCYSWMLDDDLREYLPPTSNIIRFIDRFQIAYRFNENDAGILRFVFGRSDLPLDAYPQTTTLERAVIAHIKSGRHWHGGAGWFRLPSGG